MKTKGEIFGAIIGAVANLAGSLLGAVSGVKPIVATNKGYMGKETQEVAVKMSDQLGAMKDFLLGDGGFLNALKDALPPLVQSILGIEIPGDPETIKAKAEILASVVGMVGEMLGIFGKMMEMVGGEIVPGVQKDMATKMAELTLIMEQISPVFQSLSAPLGTLVSTFINAAALIPGDSKSVSESATKFSTVLEAVMGGISSLQKMWQDMTQAGGGDSATGVGVAFESIVATMSWADYAFTAITPYLINVSKQINDMAAGAGDATANIEKVSANIEGIIGIGSVLSRMQYSASAFADAAKVKISGDVKAIIDDIRQTNEALAELGEIDIYATIDKMGEALALKSEVLKIESKPIQMNVNINLTMKADDIAKEIMDVTAKTLKDKDKASDGMKELFPGMAI
jgi:hypothetical protein